jgi:hypothetical protein
MGSRSRKRRVRGEAAAEQVRADLEPLAPGERPKAVTVAAVVSILLALANLVLLVAGFDVRGEDPQVGGVVIFSGLMLVAAYFMLKCRYWAVLGFQALLALSCIVAGLSLLVASNVQGAVLCLAILGGAGTLFWFLVRAMARLQMPERPDKVTRHG